MARRSSAIERGFTVATSDGPITARRIVNCAGAEAGRIAAMVGVTLPIEAHPIQVNVTEPVAPLIPHLVYFAGERLTLKQARSGGFLIGGGWPARLERLGRPVVDPDSVRANLRAAIHVVPALRRVQLLRTWPALVNGTDDWRPILGELPGVPGMFIGMFPWLGFSAGPIAARCVADCVLGREPEVDIRCVFRHDASDDTCRLPPFGWSRTMSCASRSSARTWRGHPWTTTELLQDCFGNVCLADVELSLARHSQGRAQRHQPGHLGRRAGGGEAGQRRPAPPAPAPAPVPAEREVGAQHRTLASGGGQGRLQQRGQVLQQEPRQQPPERGHGAGVLRAEQRRQQVRGHNAKAQRDRDGEPSRCRASAARAALEERRGSPAISGSRASAIWPDALANSSAATRTWPAR